MTALAYASSLPGDFVWDDRVLVLGVASRPTSLLRIFTEPYFDWWGCYFRPLTMLTFVLQSRTSGAAAAPYHVFNLVVHLACVALVFALSRRSGASAPAGAGAAALFGLFPRLTESVTWISGRTDVLATAGVLGALLVATRRTARSPYASAALLGAGLLSKEIAMAGLPALAVLEYRTATGSTAERLRSAFRRLLPALAVTAAFLLARYLVLPNQWFHDGLSPERRAALALQSLGTFAWMVLRPLSPATFIGDKTVPSLAFELLGLALLVFVAAIGWSIRRASAGVLAAATLAAVGLLPVIHLFPLPVTNVASDRFLYLPVAGLAVALAGGLSAPASPTLCRVAALATLVLVVSFGVATFRRNRDWRDEIAFWTAAVEPPPPVPAVAWSESADLLFREGRYRESAALRRRLLEARDGQPGSAERVRKNAVMIAICLAEDGQEGLAADLLARLESEDPSSGMLRTNAAAVHLRRLDFAAARREIEAALRIDPGSVAARELLARVDGVEKGLASLAHNGAGSLAARARILEAAGTRPALRAWEEVAAGAGASPEEQGAAAAFLVANAPVAVARRLLANLDARGIPLRGRQDLERALELRSERSARLDVLVARLGLGRIS